MIAFIRNYFGWYAWYLVEHGDFNLLSVWKRYALKNNYADAQHQLVCCRQMLKQNEKEYIHARVRRIWLPLES